MKQSPAAVFLIVLLFSSANGQATNKRPGEKWMIYSDCPSPYELVVLSVTHTLGHLYILTDGKYFNERDLTPLFTCISKKYSEFSGLRITLYSDRKNLQRAIDNHFRPPDPEVETVDQDCSETGLPKKPCPYGYHRAIYYRDADREFYDYLRDPNWPATTRVYLKGQK